MLPSLIVRSLLLSIVLMLGCNTPADKPHTAESAKELADVTVKLERSLVDLATALESGGPDVERDKKLLPIAQVLELSPAMFDLRDLPREVAIDQAQFYAGVSEVRRLVETHVKSAKLDAPALAMPKTDRPRLAIVMGDPDRGEDKGAKLVEVGPPMCGGKLARSESCPDGEEVSGMTYRLAPEKPWVRIDAERLVPLVPTAVLDGLASGNLGTMAEMDYTRRVKAMRERVTALVELGHRLEAKLRQLAAT